MLNRKNGTKNTDYTWTVKRTLQYIISVSYTHLDVYKRQVENNKPITTLQIKNKQLKAL